MNKVSLALTAIMTLALVVVIAPNIIAMNRGKVLRNIAIWLAIFAGLALFYQTFGPGSKMPLFNAPEAMIRPAQIEGQTDTDKPDAAKPVDDKGFTPPREE